MSKGLSNTFLAFKIICLAGDLTETDKRVGGALIEHYNRKSGRCDPSVGRIALLLNVHERSVQRSVRSLTRKGYINLTRHGGFGNRNSYELHWDFLREEDTAWSRRFRNLRTELATSVSPQGRQEGRSGVGPDATLTCLNNLTPLTCDVAKSQNEIYSATANSELSGNAKPSQVLSMPATRSLPMFADALKPRQKLYDAAEARWNRSLQLCWGDNPAAMAEIVDAMTPELHDEITAAEARQHGAGIRYLQSKLGHLISTQAGDR